MLGSLRLVMRSIGWGASPTATEGMACGTRLNRGDHQPSPEGCWIRGKPEVNVNRSTYSERTVTVGEKNHRLGRFPGDEVLAGDLLEPRAYERKNSFAIVTHS